MEEIDFRNIFDLLPGNYLVLKPDPPRFTILAFNKARAKATMSDESVIGRGLFEIFPDNPYNPEATGVSNLNRSLQEVIRSGKTHTMPLQRYDLFNPATSAYEERYWLPQNIPVFENGRISCIIHAVEDVTENILLERKNQNSLQEVERLHQEQSVILERNERKFRAIVENIADGIASFSAKGELIEISSSGKKMIGHHENELKGELWKDLIYSEDLSQVCVVFNKVLQEAGSSGEVEYRVRNGHDYKWMEGRFQNLFHEESIQAVVHYFRDISERKLHQQQLMASEEKYRYLFENSPATKLVWTLKDLKIREINQTAILNFGYTRDEFHSLSALDILPVEEHERLLNLQEELKRSSLPRHTGVWPYLKKNNEIMYMNVSFHAIDYSGHAAVMVLATNITERILLERKLYEERRRRQQEITEAVISAQENERAELGKELHDNINQLLTTSRIYMEYVLAKKGNQDELVMQGKEYIAKAISEIRSLSRNLLLPSLNEISLKDTLEDMISHFKVLKKTSLKFIYNVPDDVPVNPRIRLALFRIIQEQTNNIFKHAKATEALIRMEVAGKTLVLQIKDNGIGFNTRKENKGLGLKNIRSRTNLLGGSCEIISESGKGTELVVSLPLEF